MSHRGGESEKETMSGHTMILTSQSDRVRTITLNRPDDLNPLSWQVLNEIAQELEDALDDDGTGVIVIGAAGKAFQPAMTCVRNTGSPANIRPTFPIT